VTGSRIASSLCRCSVSSVPVSMPTLELSSHVEESQTLAERLLTGSPASTARLGRPGADAVSWVVL
jgi:hypothetical protein